MAKTSGKRRISWLFIGLVSIAGTVMVAILALGCQPAQEAPFDASKNYLATIETDKGDIIIELHADVAPKTVANFVKLARQGFYDGLTFHRVEPGFVIQGGDPKGDGTGGPGYEIEAEISDLRHLAGTVAMARKPDQVNPQRRSSGSQFYICLAATPFLDGDYTIFGQVRDGMDTVLRIERGDVMKKVLIAER